MPVLLSIDPGHSTAHAVFLDGRLLYAATTSPPHLELAAVLGDLDPCDEIVCEKGPAIRKQEDTCARVEALVREHAPHVSKVTWIRPTEWKPSPRGVILEDDPPLATKHEKDAVRMGRVFLSREESK